MEFTSYTLISSSVDPDVWTARADQKADSSTGQPSQVRNDISTYQDIGQKENNTPGETIHAEDFGKTRIDQFLQTNSNEIIVSESTDDIDSQEPTSSYFEGHFNSLATDRADQLTKTDPERTDVRLGTPSAFNARSSPYPDTHDRAGHQGEETLLDRFLTEELAGPADMLALQSEGTEVPPSVTNTTALCKYRWSISSSSRFKNVEFHSPKLSKESISLSWDEQGQAYFSDNVRVACGDYFGTLVVDGNSYPVEEFFVRSYTFEIDLYIKEDLPIDVSAINGKRPSLRDQEPKHKMKDAGDDFDSFNSHQTFITSLKRDSPIGDADSGKFIEPSSSRSSMERGENLGRFKDQIKVDLAEQMLKSNLERKMDFVEDIISRPPSVPFTREDEITTLKRTNSFSGLRSSVSPFISQTEQISNSHNDLMSFSRPSSSAGRPEHTGLFSGRQTPMTDHRPSSSHSLQSPAAAPSPHLQNPLAGHNMSQTYPSPQDAQRSSAVTSRPPSIGGRPSSSQTSSRTSLLSVSSEQELAQFLDRNKNVGSLSVSSESQLSRSLDRTSNLPTFPAHQMVNSDVRSTTPDNRIRVPSADLPGYKNTLSTERMEDAIGRTGSHLSLLSRGSSRSTTPVAQDLGPKDVSVLKLQDLESTIASLRKLLSSREAEVHLLTAQIADLKDINRSLREDLEHKSQRQTPVLQDSHEFKQLLREKDILASEVVVLREQVAIMGRSHSGRSSSSSAIVDYSPNSPQVLLRRIGDLEAQIRDLHEVNETTTSALLRTEEKLKQLEDENRESRPRSSTYKESQSGSEVLNLKSELKALRGDYNSLKERNFVLTEENLKLLEQQEQRARHYSGTDRARVNASYKADENLRQEHSSHSKSKAELPYTSSSQLPDRSTQPSSRSTQDKDAHHSYQGYSYVKTSDPGRLLQQRDILESARLRSQSKDTKLPPDNLKTTFPDRSRPDGEVSDYPFADKYLKRSDESPSFNLDRISGLTRETRTVSDVQRKDSYEDRTREDRYRNMARNEVKVTDRHNSSSGPINSKDIFLNVQSRTRQWLNEVAKADVGSVAKDADYESDSTEDLVSTFRPGQSDQKTHLKKIQADSLGGSNQFFTPDNKYISGNLDFSKTASGRQTDDTGDDSDTATDILLSQDTIARGSTKRRSSLGSDGTSSTLSDNDDDSYLRRRSKSVETNRGKHGTSVARGMTGSKPGSTLDTMRGTCMDSTRGSAGLRSVIAAPIVTQHNKGELASRNFTSLLNSSLTHGLRPFAPRSIADIRVDDVVKFSRVGGKLTQGVVKYVGHLPGRSEAYLGVELDKDEGKHDGTFEGIRYFKCKPNKGVFVAFNKVVMAWAP